MYAEVQLEAAAREALIPERRGTQQTRGLSPQIKDHILIKNRHQDTQQQCQMNVLYENRGSVP